MPGSGQPGPESLRRRVLPCPCDLKGLAELAEQRPSLVIGRDSDASSRRFHPGAVDVYRVYDPTVDPVAGNQCSYDARGSLIPDGPAAGTPDRVSPAFSVRAHFFKDVVPFLRLGWKKYHEKGWAPVSEAEPVP